MVLVLVLVAIVLRLVEGEGGIDGYWRRWWWLLHLASEGEFVRMVEGDGLGGVGGLEVVATMAVGYLGEIVVGVSNRSGRHDGK